MNNNHNILICPLEWGLGHAARMIPLASRLRSMNNNVIIAAGKEHLALFRCEMPGVTLISFPGFKPGYSKHLPQYLAMLIQTPVLLYHIIKEHVKLKQIIHEHNIDIVISDNRFGLWNKRVKTVYVTHMPLIPLPGYLAFLEFIGTTLHRAVIKKYNFCFIPDLSGEINVSGRLTHGVRLPSNTRFIGILSRFTDVVADETANPVKYRHNTVILSGPEPQRSILRNKLRDILKQKDIVSVFFRGTPDKNSEALQSDNIIFYDHLCAPLMKAVITGSESIITRSGYTTIMELISLNSRALLIPTPGQTEQEYLANYLETKGWFTTITQEQISPQLSLPSTKAGWTEDIMNQSRDLLEKALKELLED